MLREYAMAVKRLFQQSVKGEVKFWLLDDTIIFTIYCVNSLVFLYKLENASEQICKGLSGELCNKMILKRYNSYFRNLFFK